METREEIVAAIIERVKAYAGDGDYTEATAFADLNLKSSNYSQMINVLEDGCDVEIPYMEFKRKKTIGEAADFIMNLVEC
ncbi:MAG: acyl carrier protein [Lachnospiraceae bacterium]|nr:acyl carrier protein [Lachnospiraceae bacterium]